MRSVLTEGLTILFQCDRIQLFIQLSFKILYLRNMLHAPRDAVRINELEAHNDLSEEICSVSAKFYFTLLQIRNIPIYEKIRAPASNWGNLVTQMHSNSFSSQVGPALAYIVYSCPTYRFCSNSISTKEFRTFVFTQLSLILEFHRQIPYLYFSF